MVSQFAQQVRAVCGLPLGNPQLISPVVMVNILGDAWLHQTESSQVEVREPDWAMLLADPAVQLHLYGKGEHRPGRKMGHFTVRAETADAALAQAQKLKARL